MLVWSRILLVEFQWTKGKRPLYFLRFTTPSFSHWLNLCYKQFLPNYNIFTDLDCTMLNRPLCHLSSALHVFHADSLGNAGRNGSVSIQASVERKIEGFVL